MQGRFVVRAVRFVIAALVLAALLAAAGCGGSSSNSSSNSSSSNESSASDWASGLCTALTTWTNSVKSAGDKSRAMSPRTASTPPPTTSRGDDTLVSDLKDLGKPNTEQGQDAKKAMDKLSTRSRAT